MSVLKKPNARPIPSPIASSALLRAMRIPSEGWLLPVTNSTSTRPRAVTLGRGPHREPVGVLERARRVEQACAKCPLSPRQSES